MQIYLVRHASHSLLDRILCGRSIDVGLNAACVREANELADRFGASVHNVSCVHVSPRRRARETALPIARRLGVQAQIAVALDEHDAGKWSGLAFAALARDPDWRVWNSERGSRAPPAGESMGDLQRRVVWHLETLAAQAPLGSAIVVLHAEPIRAAVMHYRGIPFSEFHRVKIEPAGVIVLDITPEHIQVHMSNIKAAA